MFPSPADMCGKFIVIANPDGLATISRQQCVLPLGHFGGCMTPRQVMG